MELGLEEYFIVDREELSTDKLLKYEIKADQGSQAIDGIAVENPFVYVYEIEGDGSPKSSNNYEISSLTFFKKTHLQGFLVPLIMVQQSPFLNIS